MNRVTALLLCFCIAIPAAFGACPAQNPLTALDLGTQVVGTAVISPAPAICPRLGGTIKPCCDPTLVIAKFQDKSDAISTAVSKAAGDRDKALLLARKNLRALDTNYTALWTALNNSKTKVDAYIAGSDATNKANAQAVKNFQVDYFDFYDKVFAGYDGIFSNFNDYLTQRQTCMNKLLEFTANIKCYACGEDSGSDIGGTATAATVTTTEGSVATALATACWNYLNSSDFQNNIFQLSPYNTSLTDLTAAAIQIANGTDSALATFVAKLTTVKSAAKTYPAGIMPGSCTSTACTWITTNLLNNGMFGLTQDNRDTVIRGGDLYTYVNSRRVLTGSEGESRSRRLDFTSTTAPAGVKVNFPQNPGDVKNERDPLGSSAFRVGVISSLVALFVAFLF